MEVTYGPRQQERLMMAAYLDETLAVPVGGLVCFDRTNATVDKRNYYCKRPTLANVTALAGIVIDTGREWKVGPRSIEIAPVDHGVMRGIQVLTDELVVVGDFIGPIPGQFAAGKAVLGDIVCRVTEAGDGSGANPVLVKCDVGRIADFPDFAKKVVRHVDDFEGKSSVGVRDATAGASLAPTYSRTGTNVVVDYLASWGPEKAGVASANGVLSLLSATTTNANLQLSGEPFRLDASKAIFFQARVALVAVTAEDAFVGLAIQDTTFIAGHNDGIGFRITNGAVTFTFQKGAAGEITVTPVPAVAVTAGNFIELSFLVRNRAAAVGKKDIFIWADGVLVAYANNDTDRAEVPDDQSLTALFEVIGSAAAQQLLIDRLAIQNYIG